MANDSSSPASFTHLSVLRQTTYLAQSHSALRSFATSLIDSTSLDTFCLGIPTLPDFDAPFARCLVSRLRHFLGVFHSLTPKFCIFSRLVFFVALCYTVLTSFLTFVFAFAYILSRLNSIASLIPGFVQHAINGGSILRKVRIFARLPPLIA